MAPRQANLGRRPARPLEASVKATEVFDDPTTSKTRWSSLRRHCQFGSANASRSARLHARLAVAVPADNLSARGAFPRPRDALPRRYRRVSPTRRLACISQRDGEPLPLAPGPRPQPTARPQPASRPQPAARPLAVAAARPLAAPWPEPLADARQDRRRHGRARHGHGLPLERPRLRVHQAGAFYCVLYTTKGGVAQWQSVRFACGKPRVQTPAPPPTHI